MTGQDDDSTTLEVRFDDGVSNHPPAIHAVQTRELDGVGTVELEVEASDPEGDGRTSTLPVPMHVYAAPGHYLVSVTVSDREHEVTLTLEVDATQAANIPPVADAGPDLTVRLGQTGTLDGSNSHDPDNYPVGLRFFWTAPPEIQLQSPNGRTTRFTATALGEYEVELSVFDGAA